ncbi:MAG: S1 RNA-binding domain-containing protein [Anaerolineae bacterium]
MIQDPQAEVELSFAELLEAYDYSLPERGEIIEGVVLMVDTDEILVDVGQKRDAVVPRKDLSLLPQDVLAAIRPGQRIMTYVLQPRNSEGDLIVSINKAFELEDWNRAHSIMESEGIVEARVSEANRGGVMVSYGRLTGFVPQSHLISLPRFASQDELHEAKRKMIGRTLSLKFIEIDRKRNRLILSERAARQELQQNRLSEIQVGDKVKGRVVSIVDFGAFVDIGGVDGLIHISKLTHNHVNHPGEVLAVGDEVEVLIDNVDVEKQRISLDRAALLPDPWDSVLEVFTVGALVNGIVTNVVDFGVFVRLENHLQGLIHISHMSLFGTKNPHDVLSEGDQVLARIISIEPEERRIGLSIDAVTVEEQETWMHARGGDTADATPVTDDVDDVDVVADAPELDAAPGS